MSKYSPEIIKAAEELIEKHKSCINPRIITDKPESQEWADKWWQKLQDAPSCRERAIEAAIVSCKFAIERVSRTGGSFPAWPDEVNWELAFSNEVKAYLEELL